MTNQRMLKTGLASIIGLGLVACAKEEKSAVSDAIEAEEAKPDLEREAEAPDALDSRKGPTPEELAQLAADNAAEAEAYFAEYTNKEGVKVTESGLHLSLIHI